VITNCWLLRPEFEEDDVSLAFNILRKEMVLALNYCNIWGSYPESRPEVPFFREF